MKQFTSIVARLTQWYNNDNMWATDVVACNVCTLKPVAANTQWGWPERTEVMFIGGHGIYVLGNIEDVKKVLGFESSKDENTK